MITNNFVVNATKSYIHYFPQKIDNFIEKLHGTIKKYRETIVYLIRAIDPKRYNQRWPMTPAWE